MGLISDGGGVGGRGWLAMLLLAALVSCDDAGRQRATPAASSTTTAPAGTAPSVPVTRTISPASTSTVPAGPTTVTSPQFVTGPQTFRFGTLAFDVPPAWSATTGDRGRPDPNLAYIGDSGGFFPGSANLRIVKEYDGPVDSLRPTECPGDAQVNAAPPAGVELLESGFAPVSNRTAEYRRWRFLCPGMDSPVLDYRAWLLPVSRVGILSRRYNPTVANIIATVSFV